jgi:hypothetical protein
VGKKLTVGSYQFSIATLEPKAFGTATCGVPEAADGMDSSELIEAADKALYKAKQRDRNCVEPDYIHEYPKSDCWKRDLPQFWHKLFERINRHDMTLDFVRTNRPAINELPVCRGCSGFEND